MPIVALEDIHITFGPKRIFDGLGVAFYPQQKVGLVGPNGCGKTTLLKLILGSEEADVGNIKRRKSISVAYLPQEPQFDDDKTVIEELHKSAGHILRLQRKIHSLAETMERLSGRELKETMRQYDRLLNEFTAAGGYRYESRMKEISAALGLDEKFYKVRTSKLSGGQKSRLGLAKVLLADADLLLLDEPTNHLDFDAMMWLESYLNNFDGAAVIVSHDRFLLDKLVTKIVEVRDKKAAVYPGNYSNFRREKEKRDLEQQRVHRQRVEFVERTRDFVARNKDQEGMRKVARGRKKQLNDLLEAQPDFLDKPTSEKELKFDFAKVEQKSKREVPILICDKLTKSYDQLTLFKDINMEVAAGHRLGIIGPNGCGKTTFLRLALGRDEPSGGVVKLKPNLSIGYLDQSGTELNDSNTVLEEAATGAGKVSTEKVRSKLGAFLFSGDEVFKSVGQLSGGERNRLGLCKLVLSQPEVLVLDEPTNHLDIASIEALEEALQNFAGTIIVVSHDRFFLDKVAERLLVLGVDETGKKRFGGYELVDGSFSIYSQLLERRRKQRELEEEKANKPKGSKQTRPRSTTPEELKQFNAWKEEKFHSEIERVEEQIIKLTERFGEEGIYKDPKELSQLKKQMDAKKEYLELMYRAYERRL